MKFMLLPNKKIIQKGVMLVILVPFLMVIFCLVFLLMDVGRITAESEKTQIISDQMLLSILNVRADSLQHFAQQQTAIVDLIQSAGPNSAFVPQQKWATLAATITKTKSALSGYKGRLTSIMTVFMEANGRDRKDLNVLDETALKINVEPQSQWVIDEWGNKKIFSALWYRRQWLLDSATKRTNESAAIEIQTPMLWKGRFALQDIDPSVIKRKSHATLAWDAEEGNGGYPAQWGEAFSDGRFTLYQSPYFQAQLSSERKSR